MCVYNGIVVYLLIKILSTMKNSIVKFQPILLVSSSAGIYIPQLFAERYLNTTTNKVTFEKYHKDLSDPNGDFYWESWEEAINDTYVLNSDFPNVEWQLVEYEGDLWGIPVNEKYRDKDCVMLINGENQLIDLLTIDPYYVNIDIINSEDDLMVDGKYIEGVDFINSYHSKEDAMAGLVRLLNNDEINTEFFIVMVNEDGEIIK